MGSDRTADLVLDDPAVSARHCEFLLTELGVLLRDLGSKNGTFVDSVRVHRATISARSEVRVGRSILTLVDDGEDSVEEISSSFRCGNALSCSPVMRAIFERIAKVAPSDVPVLFIGESGTGKEVLAEAIHTSSGREGDFVVLDCASIPSHLLEAEVFGWEKGAYTGADRARRGLFEEADRGTLFLDEVGELPLEQQAKLLRVLDTGAARRIGANQSNTFEVRILAATHRNLSAMVNRGEFRRDLYYRLATIQIAVPPLRARPDDVLLLADRFLEELGDARRFEDFGQETVAMFREHDWRGNVRELRNAVTRLVFGDMPIDSDGKGDGDLVALPWKMARVRAIEVFEQRYLLAMMGAVGGSRTRAAERMGISRQLLHRMLKKYGISS